jgi:hypothetical protein
MEDDMFDDTPVLTRIEGIDYAPRETEVPTALLTFACQQCGAALYIHDLPRHSMWHHVLHGMLDKIKFDPDQVEG